MMRIVVIFGAHKELLHKIHTKNDNSKNELCIVCGCGYVCTFATCNGALFAMVFMVCVFVHSVHFTFYFVSIILNCYCVRCRRPLQIKFSSHKMENNKKVE